MTQWIIQRKATLQIWILWILGGPMNVFEGDGQPREEMIEIHTKKD